MPWGGISWPSAFSACFLGIWIGDAGLYALARWAGRGWFERSSLRRFAAKVAAELDKLAAATASPGPAMLVGSVFVRDGALHNGIALLDQGKVAAVRFKHELPNYGGFDEPRGFSPGPLPEPIVFDQAPGGRAAGSPARSSGCAITIRSGRSSRSWRCGQPPTMSRVTR